MGVGVTQRNSAPKVLVAVTTYAMTALVILMVSVTNMGMVTGVVKCVVYIVHLLRYVINVNVIYVVIV